MLVFFVLFHVCFYFDEKKERRNDIKGIENIDIRTKTDF